MPNFQGTARTRNWWSERPTLKIWCEKCEIKDLQRNFTDEARRGRAQPRMDTNENEFGSERVCFFVDWMCLWARRKKFWLMCKGVQTRAIKDLGVKRSVKTVKKVKSTGCEGVIPFPVFSARLGFDLYIVRLFGRGASDTSAVNQLWKVRLRRSANGADGREYARRHFERARFTRLRLKSYDVARRGEWKSRIFPPNRELNSPRGPSRLLRKV
jgi:hypothetical protein